jgi:hypothetical protein
MLLRDLADLIKRAIKVDPEAANADVRVKPKTKSVNYVSYDTKRKKAVFWLEE